ncbi:hypothetical protein ACFFS2_08805 [Streptomyces aurantiacus]|uniref:Tetratricopeptide repeat protein n=1 Tax=Streptomyces aurantiacus TaxID=47760 RepID=A0A7G1NRN9_9ACTN|nr:hypothetical protein [Streptomyces aurantiacus]BCL25519.1 hypothetical protein GCM10017557_03780 [Streptomyces aurantiacus]
MFSKHTQDQQAGTTQDTARTESPFGVLIDHNGSTAVDGVPFQVPEGEPVHVTVLDLMHRHAHARGRPVEAVILDQQRGDVTLVEVAPDGSSRVLLHELHDETPETQPRPTAAPPPAASQPGPPPVAAPQPGPPPAPAPPTAPAPPMVEAADPPPAVAPAAVAAVPVAAEAVPEELAELVGLVRQCLDTGALERAAALAFRLREHTSRTYGPEHLYTLEAHALEGFVAHRSDNFPLAMATCLELARIRHSQGDWRAREELTRATAAWLRIDDMPLAVAHGRNLLAALLAVWSRGNQDGRTVAEATLPGLVNRRMRVLTNTSDTRVTGVA